LLFVVVVYHIARTVTSSQAARWAAMVTAMMPAMMYYSAEARYPMTLALVLGLAYLALQHRRWALFSLTSAAACLIHVNAWFYVVILGTFAVYRTRRPWAVTVPALAIAWWFPTALAQASDVSDGFWIMQSTPVRFLVDMTITTRFPGWPLGIILLIVIAALGIIGAAVWAWRRDVSWLWLAAVVVPPVVQWSVGVVWSPIYLERTLLFSAALLVIPVGAWIERYGHQRVMVLGAAALLMALGSLTAQDRSIADDVLDQCGDRIVYAPTTYSAILASHYSDRVVVTSPESNTTAQELPRDVRRMLWLWNYEPDLQPGFCLFAQVDGFTSDEQVQHITALAPDAEIVRSNRFAYYAVAPR
ncbi:MAG: hypothetical protein AAF125_18320, partial [Chloroflexota bacterium]